MTTTATITDLRAPGPEAALRREVFALRLELTLADLARDLGDTPELARAREGLRQSRCSREVEIS